MGSEQQLENEKETRKKNSSTRRLPLHKFAYVTPAAFNLPTALQTTQTETTQIPLHPQPLPPKTRLHFKKFVAKMFPNRVEGTKIHL